MTNDSAIFVDSKNTRRAQLEKNREGREWFREEKISFSLSILYFLANVRAYSSRDNNDDDDKREKNATIELVKRAHLLADNAMERNI